MGKGTIQYTIVYHPREMYGCGIPKEKKLHFTHYRWNEYIEMYFQLYFGNFLYFLLGPRRDRRKKFCTRIVDCLPLTERD